MTEQENDSIEHVEQITKDPVVHISQAVPDPKKVAAGRKLEAYNKKAKENKNKFSPESAPTNYDSESNSGKFNFSLSAVIAILGLGLSAVDLYFRYKTDSNGAKDFKMDD